MSIDISQFHQTFFEESREGLDLMESSLLQLDVGAADPETVNSIFRAAHSIKGGAGTFGFTAVSEFTHLVETLLDQMRSGERAVTREIVDLLLASVDVLRDMLQAAQEGGDVDPARVAEVQDALARALGAGQAAPATGGADSARPAMGKTYVIRFKPHADMLRTGNDPVRIFRELATLGHLCVEVDAEALPGLEALDPEAAYLGWTLRLEHCDDEAAVRAAFEWVEDECELEIAAADAAQAARPGTEGRSGRAAASTEPKAGSIRVDIGKVDAIINLVGELVITQSMLGQIGAAFEDGEHAGSELIEKLHEGLAQLERNTRELQESVMQIRMLPISFSFSRFPRLVRDLSAKLGKQVELQVFGEQTELDKTVMERIGDPLVHLVRNALDHGIEPPEVRRAAGKPETGVISLNAYHKSGNIVIEIADDGAGLDEEKILAKARHSGLVSDEAELDKAEIYKLIFEPGFSTAENVSDISGRGVGMDVVMKNIRALGGRVEVESEPGRGTTFTVRLPLTLSILDGQLVKVDGQIYVIPLVSIVESLQIERERVMKVAGRAEVYRLRDDYLPVVCLRDAFGAAGRRPELDDALMVVVEGDGRKVGLVVDDLLAQQQVVIKSLETNFRRVPGMSGATILGDGTVALILDIGELVAITGSAGPGNGSAAAGNSSEAA